MATQIQLRRGTAAQWTSANPVLASGEPGYETDTSKLKFGDGATAWATLPYYAAPGGSSGSSALTRTAVKTANYTAAAGDLVPCDPTGGAFTVTLPNAPADKTLVEVKIVTATAPNAVTVACAGSDVLNRAAGATSTNLQIPGHSATFQYDTATHIWTITQSDTPLAQLDLRYAAIGSVGGGGTTLTPTAVKTANYTAAVGDLVPVDATAGAITITLPSAPADKAQVAVKKIDTSNNTVTVARGGTDVFNKAGGSTSVSLTVPGYSVVLQYQASGGIWYVVSSDEPVGSLDTRYQASPAAQIAAPWVASATETAGQLVSQGGVIYTVPTSRTAAGTFSAGSYTLGAAAGVSVYEQNGSGQVIAIWKGAALGTAASKITDVIAGPIVGTSIADLTIGARNLTDLAREHGLIAGHITQTMPFWAANSSVATVSGSLLLGGFVVLPGGRTITSITLMSGATAAVTPANLWFALYDRSRNLLAQSTDLGSGWTWAANTVKTIALSTPYTPANAVEAYVGVMAVATTVPNFAGGASTNVGASVTGSEQGGLSTTGLTTTAPATAAAISPTRGAIWASLS